MISLAVSVGSSVRLVIAGRIVIKVSDDFCV